MLTLNIHTYSKYHVHLYSKIVIDLELKQWEFKRPQMPHIYTACNTNVASCLKRLMIIKTIQNVFLSYRLVGEIHEFFGLVEFIEMKKLYKNNSPIKRCLILLNQFLLITTPHSTFSRNQKQSKYTTSPKTKSISLPYQSLFQ